MMDDVLTFADEPSSTNETSGQTWKILIADDEPSVHLVTKLALGDFVFEGRRLTLLSAYGEDDTRRLLVENPDIALILLDVVMDAVDSGFALVRYIRDTLANKDLRIIMRTGQSGNAPEDRIIIDYDINDFKDKTELTVAKLRTTMISSLRTYSHLQIIALEQQKTQASRSYLHTIINSLSSVVLTVDDAMRVLLWNQEAERWTGVPAEKAVGAVLFETAPVFSPLRALLADVLRAGKIERSAVPLWKGEQVFVHLMLQVIKGAQGQEILIRLDDRTVAKYWDDHLLRSQKVNAFRSMATGIAGELRGILGWAGDPRARLKDWGARAEVLLDRLAQFSMAESVPRRPVDWAAIVRESLMTLTRPTAVVVQSDLPEQPAWVLGAEESLRAVVNNLLENAVAALEAIGNDGPPRTMEVSLSSYRLTESDVQTHPDLADVPFWSLVVVDHGVGMSAATSQRVLDPSFSTKPSAQGLGLGLPLVYSVVESLGGFIAFESKPGTGTRASVYLPRGHDWLKPDEENQSVVLVCDGEPLMRQVAARILRSAGYAVIEASDGPAALEILATAPVTLVIVDPLCADRPATILEELRRRHPSVPLIVASNLGERADGDSPWEVLSKPYQAQQVLEAVQRVRGSLLPHQNEPTDRR